jgi:hypothetical protein
MLKTLDFEKSYHYSLYEIGITVPVCLTFAEKDVEIVAKIDTGSTYCVFQRLHGELLDLEIENGLPVTIGTATGTFKAFGYELSLSVLGIETVSTVYFAESDYFDRNVLGRIGWLNKVKLALIDEENKLFLSEYK